MSTVTIQATAKNDRYSKDEEKRQRDEEEKQSVISSEASLGKLGRGAGRMQQGRWYARE